MTTPDPIAPLERLLALVGEALALSDAQHLHAAGIALDTARLSVEGALDEAHAMSVPGGEGGAVLADRSGSEWRDGA